MRDKDNKSLRWGNFGESDEKKSRRKDKPLSAEEQETLVDKEPIEVGEEEAAEILTNSMDEDVWPPKKPHKKYPKGVLPRDTHALLSLIDISGPVKEIRGVPQAFYIRRPNTLIGIGKKASIRLDDPNSVKVEHARLIYEEENGEKVFILYPVGHAPVSVNGNSVSKTGVSLRNGDRLKIGSADLVFFQKDLSEKSKTKDKPLPVEDRETLLDEDEDEVGEENETETLVDRIDDQG